MSSSEIRSQIAKALDDLYQLDGDLAEEWEDHLYNQLDGGLFAENWNEDTLHDILLDVRAASPTLYSYTEITPND